MSDSSSGRKRFLYITVQDAIGKTKEDGSLWEPSFTEGFVRVEVRGGVKTLKATTMPQGVQNDAIIWKQELRIEINDDAKELRLMLCKQKPREPRNSSMRPGTAIVAACGIFINDILDAVPIDKYFELFKPGEGGLGGKIRVTLQTDITPRQPLGETQRNVRAQGMSAAVSSAVQHRVDAYDHGHDEQDETGGGTVRWLLLGGVAAAVVITKILRSRSKRR